MKVNQRILISLLAIGIAVTAGAQQIDVKAHGATGDGRTDDTKAIQKAIDGAKVGDTIYFPAGRYMISSINLKPGVNLKGDNQEATLFSLPNMPNFTHMVDTYKSAYRYSSDTDSPNTYISGLSFDGDRNQQGSYTRYEKEHSALIFLGADAKRKGRLRTIIENCTFKNGDADAISVYVNTTTTIKNVRALNCFRGAITVTGGSSRTAIEDVITAGDHSMGIHSEVDAAGFNGQASELILDKVRCDDPASFVVQPGSEVRVTNSEFNNYVSYYAKGSRMLFSNDTFHSRGYAPDGSSGKILCPGITTFSHCEFTISPDAHPQATLTGVYAQWQVQSRPATGQRLTFQNCTFNAAQKPGGKPAIAVMLLTPGKPSDDNVLVMENCEIGRDFTAGIYMPNGGQSQLSGLRNGAVTGVVANKVIRVK